MNKLTPFHLAIPVDNIAVCRKFYREILGCEEGRSSDHWVDFNLFGHQLVIHYKEKYIEEIHTNPVDGKNVPVPHFGIVLTIEEFKEFEFKIHDKNLDFIIKPTVRFEGEVGEQRTMFFKDPSGNAIEVKGFKDMDSLFKS